MPLNLVLPSDEVDSLLLASIGDLFLLVKVCSGSPGLIYLSLTPKGLLSSIENLLAKGGCPRLRILLSVEVGFSCAFPFLDFLPPQA